jgi:hypothetical protein
VRRNEGKEAAMCCWGTSPGWCVSVESKSGHKRDPTAVPESVRHRTSMRWNPSPSDENEPSLNVVNLAVSDLPRMRLEMPSVFSLPPVITSPRIASACPPPRSNSPCLAMCTEETVYCS